VAFAFQMVFSTLVNAVLHDGGPLRLHDAALARELARAFVAIVGPADGGRTPVSSAPA
jgi:hypothetical protein